MKPYMQFQWGQWYCGVRALNATRIGVGNTQEEAYYDWQIRTSHPAIAREEEARSLKILREFDANRALRANPAATTCPECNMAVRDNICTNRDCKYCGPGWTLGEREKAWRNHGAEERTTGSQYDYTGRE
jgi:hypothetical protein